MKFLLKYFFLFISFVLSNNTNAQFDFVLVDSIQIPEAKNYQLKINSNNDIFIIRDFTNIDRLKDKKITNYSQKKIVSQINSNSNNLTGILFNLNELIIFDKNFAQIKESLNFNKYQIYPSAISLIDEQLLWFFDPIEQRLIQWNYSIKSEISKSNILFFNEGDFTIEEIYNFNNRLFLKSQNWIYEYDFFGNFKAKIELKKHDNYFFSNSYIYLINDQSVIKIDLLNHDFSLSDNFFYGKDFIMSNTQLFVIKNNLMYIYNQINN